MNAKKKFPSLASLDAGDLRRLLRRSTLAREDRQIAISCLQWDMAYVDVGAAVGMDRRTVSRHMNELIAPELERLMYKDSRQAV